MRGGLAGEAALRAAWASFAELAVKLHIDEDSITDPRARALLEKVDKELLEYHKQHVVGFLKMAAEQAAPQISRDITRASLGPVLLISACGAGVEQSAPEAGIHETLLDSLENPSKLRGPEISPPPVTLLWVPENLPATMPKEGVQPAPDPGEKRLQPEHTGIPFRGTETVFRRDHEQALATQVAELQQQLAEERREKAELQRQLTEERREKARQRAKANERQKQWREQNPDRAREQHTKHMRSYRARRRGQDS